MQLFDFSLNEAPDPNCCDNPKYLCRKCAAAALRNNMGTDDADGGQTTLDRQRSSFDENHGFGESDTFDHYDGDDEETLQPPNTLESIMDQRSRYPDDDDEDDDEEEDSYRGDDYMGSGRNRGGQNWGDDDSSLPQGAPAFDRNEEQGVVRNASCNAPGHDCLHPLVLDFQAGQRRRRKPHRGARAFIVNRDSEVMEPPVLVYR